MDDFCTRHILASIINEATESTTKVIGTLKFTNIDLTNRCFAKKSFQAIESKD